jgi:hypothetical protein
MRKAAVKQSDLYTGLLKAAAVHMMRDCTYEYSTAAAAALTATTALAAVSADLLLFDQA